MPMAAEKGEDAREQHFRQNDWDAVVPEEEEAAAGLARRQTD